MTFTHVQQCGQLVDLTMRYSRPKSLKYLFIQFKLALKVAQFAFPNDEVELNVDSQSQ